MRHAILATAALLTVALAASCARSVSDPITDLEATFGADSGTVQDGLCVSTDCPSPWATCAGSGLCKVNTSNDVDHCGSCDVACPKFAKSKHATSVCSGGECKYGCAPGYADCNGQAADGCETWTFDDPKNCGACGNDCKDDLCWKGACGCPSGYTRCGNECVVLASDQLNCGACGNICNPPKDANDPAWICGPEVSPPHTRWTCTGGACKLLCHPAYGDCNNQFCGDGCETLLANDPNNCGGCGKKCNEGQVCVNGGCKCNGGILCGEDCVDLQNDPNNCGACGNQCPGPSPSVGGGPGCVAGECTYVCNPGWADCNASIYDGCEVNLASDSLNCGACKKKCKGGQGQPCVDGVCLSKPCDEAGVVR